ncbi:hypothetical protein POM88_001700 [Heracleum sosnowskyi]|uniref:Uncharacterized protein n=1 Tax=Heracleum sosnowskyi TaxID=360622 RepID=A0AAD8JCQ0_9APIA|nr:hypothetical protein POM88_001700 [Heracleum sosnowskyi]
MTSIQGWAKQPNLLSSQEALARQMAGVTINDDEGSALLAGRKKKLKKMIHTSAIPHHPHIKPMEGSSATGVERLGTLGKIIAFDYNLAIRCIQRNSGCGRHLTGDDSKLSNLHAQKGKEAIVTAGNTIYSVKNEGDVVIEGHETHQINLKGLHAHVVHTGRTSSGQLTQVDVVQYEIDMLQEADQMAQRLYLAELCTFVGLHNV